MSRFCHSCLAFVECSDVSTTMIVFTTLQNLCHYVSFSKRLVHGKNRSFVKMSLVVICKGSIVPTCIQGYFSLKSLHYLTFWQFWDFQFRFLWTFSFLLLAFSEILGYGELKVLNISSLALSRRGESYRCFFFSFSSNTLYNDIL